jgi:hypothetical protein
MNPFFEEAITLLDPRDSYQLLDTHLQVNFHNSDGTSTCSFHLFETGKIESGGSSKAPLLEEDTLRRANEFWMKAEYLGKKVNLFKRITHHSQSSYGASARREGDTLILTFLTSNRDPIITAYVKEDLSCKLYPSENAFNSPNGCSSIRLCLELVDDFNLEVVPSRYA